MSLFDKLNRNDVENVLNKVVKNSDSIIRKTRKLKRDPKLFFKDSYEKRKKQMLAKIPVKYEGKNQFTVVSAVYNVEKYLDEYFISLVNQSLDFKKHIQLILVDDGSTDRSAKIIKKWQKKYPKNIHYYYKENGGQASARDYGLDYIKTEWCTFIDPDDFVDNDYFRVIDETIQSEKDLWMVSCNLIYYYEQSKQYKDNHPQNYKFRQKISFFDVKDQYQYIQLSVSLAILNTKIIQENGLRFDTRIKPSFEDATFMMNYALALHKKQGRVAFVKDAKYYYRKRENGTSTLDTGWIKPTGYDEVLRYGCLQTLKNYHESLGYVPRFIQNSVMYYHIWQIKGIVNQDNAVDFLTTEQKTEYLSLLRQIFEYIDEEAIDGFNLAGTWMFEKAGMLNLYKNQALRADIQIGFIEKYDSNKNEVLLYYFAPKDSMAVFYDNGRIIQPSHQKILRHSFLEEAFVYEYRYWLPLSDRGDISFEVDGNPTKIGFAGKHIRVPITTKQIVDYYKAQAKYPNVNDTWIIMDRDVQADDNAEHFYRYVMNNHPEQKIYFALRKASHDWDRLKAEGFNLLDFGSLRFETELKNCSKIISSHIDDYIVDYFGDKGLVAKDFVFLPHGVTQNDLFAWYNSKIQYMSLMTVSTNDEYDSIAGDYNHYKYSKKEIKLTGFPRHDALMRGNVINTKRIVVMPTWRKYLIGKYNNKTGRFLKNPEFMHSEYAQKWQAFLASDKLQGLMREYGYEVVFAPHKNTEAYLDEFTLPKNIQIWQANPSESIQKLFQTADVMITDYSSVAFEMGYLGKPVLYYQFDFESFFKEQWQRGYFDYQEHGFGAVSEDLDALLSDLEAILANGGNALPAYQKRIDETFAYRDDKNCQRVYEAILALDEKPDQKIDINHVYQSMLAYADSKRWLSVKAHAQFLAQHKDAEDSIQKEALNLLFEALMMEQQYEKAVPLYREYGERFNPMQKVKYAYFMADWQGVIEYSSNIAPSDDKQRMLAHSYAELGQADALMKVLKSLPKNTDYQKVYAQVLIALANHDWQSIIDLLGNKQLSELLPVIDELITDDQTSLIIEQVLTDYRFELILARAYRNLKMYDLANEQLAAFKQHSRNQPQCRLEIARLAVARKNAKKAVSQYRQATFDDISCLSAADFVSYVQSLSMMGDQAEIEQILPAALERYLDNQALRLEWAKHLFAKSDYHSFLEVGDQLKMQKDTLTYEFVLANYRLGLIDEAYQAIVMPNYESKFEYWMLVMEIAFAKSDIKLAKSSYQQMLAIYPQRAPEIMAKFDLLVKSYESMRILS